MKCHPIDLFLGHVHLVRYEDLCIDTLQTTDNLFRFLELPKHELIEEFMKERTKSSKNISFKWRGKVEAKDHISIQRFCKDPIYRIGYFSPNIKHIDNASMLSKTFEEVWPPLDQPIFSIN